jgi:hypothetical protein
MASALSYKSNFGFGFICLGEIFLSKRTPKTRKKASNA